jgi:glutamate dehydrogenase/leucine dehydrogenase
MITLDETLTEQKRAFGTSRLRSRDSATSAATPRRLIAQRGAKIVAVGITRAVVANEKGLDVEKLAAWVREHRTVKGISIGGDAFDGSEVLTWKADVLIPAALGDVLTRDNAGA